MFLVLAVGRYVTGVRNRTSSAMFMGWGIWFNTSQVLAKEIMSTFN